MEEAQTNIKMGNAAITGSTRDEMWAIAHSDICVQLNPGFDGTDDYENAAAVNALSKEDIQTYVLSNAAGAGVIGETQDDMNERINSVYVSTGRNSVGVLNEIVAMQIGGLATIRVTGNQTIRQGDIVLVSFPHTEHPRAITRATGIPEGKQPFWVVPFNVQMTLGSLTNSYKLLMQSMNDAKLREWKSQYPLSFRFSEALYKFALRSCYTGMMTGIRSGMVTPVNNAVTWGGDERAIPDEWAKSVAENLFDNNRKKEKQVNMGGGSTMDLKKYVFASMVGQDSKFFPFRPDRASNITGQRIYTNSHHKDLNNHQANGVTDVITAIHVQETSIRKRTLGVARSTANPGQDLDIQLKP